jgi:hypothetical protein
MSRSRVALGSPWKALATDPVTMYAMRILEPADHAGQQLGERHRAFASRDRSTFVASSGPSRICDRLFAT